MVRMNVQARAVGVLKAAALCRFNLRFGCRPDVEMPQCIRLIIAQSATATVILRFPKIPQAE